MFSIKSKAAVSENLKAIAIRIRDFTRRNAPCDPGLQARLSRAIDMYRDAEENRLPATMWVSMDYSSMVIDSSCGEHVWTASIDCVEDTPAASCSCPDWEHRSQDNPKHLCKHILALSALVITQASNERIENLAEVNQVPAVSERTPASPAPTFAECFEHFIDA